MVYIICNIETIRVQDCSSHTTEFLPEKSKTNTCIHLFPFAKVSKSSANKVPDTGLYLVILLA